MSQESRKNYYLRYAELGVHLTVAAQKCLGQVSWTGGPSRQSADELERIAKMVICRLEQYRVDRARAREIEARDDERKRRQRESDEAERAKLES